MSGDILTRWSDADVLDYDKLKHLLASYAASSGGKRRVQDCRPTTDARWIRSELAATREAIAVEGSNDPFPTRALRDVSAHVEALRAGATLEPEELREVAAHLRVTHALRTFLDRRGFSQDFPALTGRSRGLESHPELESRIDRTVGPDGEVLDSASPELRRLRVAVNRARERVQEQLRAVIDNPLYAPAIQERLVTIRNGRYVVPIKAGSRGQVRGIVQARSSSGVTLFIEPEAVVESNNSLNELAVEVRLEIARVLAELSDVLRERVDGLHRNAEILEDFDFLRAKAGFSLDFRCAIPEIVDAALLDFRSARNPLLESYFRQEHRDDPERERREVVPMDIALGDGLHGLVITGPNTGGKTVVVKTVGLLVLMAQSGIPIPADDGSICGLLDGVYADVGDEQSMEQSLSTFSAHMAHVVRAVRHATSRSLVVLDELGAGTDPVEGIPLATAVLDDLVSRGCLVLATTHHGALKVHAHSHPLLRNASLEFDEQTLSPSYRLRIGVPGRSHALRIAETLGLPAGLLEAAQDRVGDRAGQLEAIIADVEALRISAQDEHSALVEARTQAEKDRSEVERVRKDLMERRQELVRKAEGEAEAVLAEGRAIVERTVAELRRTNAAKSTITQAHTEIDAANDALRRRRDEELRDATEGVSQLAEGDRVFVKSMKAHGIVQDPPDGRSTVRVKVGDIALTVPATDVEDDADEAERQTPMPRRFQAIASAKRTSITHELDVRGSRALDAVDDVDKYLDDAALAGLELVSIIHGKGTGALRRALHDHLRDHPQVDAFRLGELDEGDAGVTIVTLRG